MARGHVDVKTTKPRALDTWPAPRQVVHVCVAIRGAPTRRRHRNTRPETTLSCSLRRPLSGWAALGCEGSPPRRGSVVVGPSGAAAAKNSEKGLGIGKRCRPCRRQKSKPPASARRAKLVVTGSLLPRRKHTESLGGLFELGGRAGIVLVAVGVVLERTADSFFRISSSEAWRPTPNRSSSAFPLIIKNLGRPREPSGYTAVPKVRRPTELSTLLR
jgi:hypothetical protein